MISDYFRKTLPSLPPNAGMRVVESFLLKCHGPASPTKPENRIGHGQKCQTHRNHPEQGQQEDERGREFQHSKKDLSSSIRTDPVLPLLVFCLIIPAD